MITITLEELKIIISAETKGVSQAVSRVKSELKGVSSTNIKINGESGGLQQALKSIDLSLNGIKRSAFSAGDALQVAIASNLPLIARLVKESKAIGTIPALLANLGDTVGDDGTGPIGLLADGISQVGLKALFAEGGLTGVLAALKALLPVLGSALPVLAAIAAAIAAIVAALAPLLISIAAVKFGETLNSWIQPAAKVEASIQSLTMSLGSAGDALAEWVDTNAASMGLSLQDANVYANQLSLLVDNFANSAQQTAAGTAQLMNAATIVASRTGRTVQDVLERFRSGMLGNTESIEDIGIQVAQSVIEQSEAFKQLGVSYQNLTANQKSYLYYQAIINQTADKYGSEVAPNAMTMSNQFSAALANLKLAFAQLALPIANIVIPWLTTFITYLTALVRIVGKVISSLLGLFGIQTKTASVSGDMDKTMSKASAGAGGVASGLGSAAKSAKEIRKTLAGFDEINNLGAQPADTGGGPGGGGPGGGIGGDIPDLSELFPDIEGAMLTVEQAIKNIIGGMMLWLQPFLDLFTGTFNNIKTFITNTMDNILNLIKGVGGGIMTIFSGVGTFVRKVWDGIGTFIETVWGAIIDLFSGKIGPKEFFFTVFGAAATLVKTIWTALKSFFDTTWKGIKQIYGSVKTFFEKQFGDAQKAVMTQWGLVKTFFETQWNNIKLVFGPVAAWFGGKFGDAWTAIKKVFAPFVSFFEGLWTSVKGVFTTIGVSLSNSIKGAINGIFSSIESKINTFIGNINTAIDLINKIPAIPTVKHIPTVKLPRLAKGGIVGSETAFIAGENGREAVFPLDRNLQWADSIADAFVSRMGTLNMGSAASGDRPLMITLKVGSSELGRVTCNSINELIAREGTIPIHI